MSRNSTVLVLPWCLCTRQLLVTSVWLDLNLFSTTTTSLSLDHQQNTLLVPFVFFAAFCGDSRPSRGRTRRCPTGPYTTLPHAITHCHALQHTTTRAMQGTHNVPILHKLSIYVICVRQGPSKYVIYIRLHTWSIHGHELIYTYICYVCTFTNPVYTSSVYRSSVYVLYEGRTQEHNTQQETTHYNTMHYNTLQHNVAHCNILQHTATYCNILPHTATYCNILPHTATHYNTLQDITHCNATHCNTLQHSATHYDTLQYTATRCRR